MCLFRLHQIHNRLHHSGSMTLFRSGGRLFYLQLLLFINCQEALCHVSCSSGLQVVFRDAGCDGRLQKKIQLTHVSCLSHSRHFISRHSESLNKCHCELSVMPTQTFNFGSRRRAFAVASNFSLPWAVMLLHRMLQSLFSFPLSSLFIITASALFVYSRLKQYSSGTF